MNNVATLIVKTQADGGSGLNAVTMTEARDRLRAADAKVGASNILSVGEAVDIFFNDLDVSVGQAVLKATFAGRPIDIFCQPVEGRRKKLLLADMDSTIITVECIDEIADMLGLKDKIAPITDAAMRGELDFEAALKERVTLLAGLDRSALKTVWEERIRFTPGARELIATMGRDGARTVLISGGFAFFTDRVKAELGFSESHANRLIFENNKLTGRVEEPITGAPAKEARLQTCKQQLGLEREEIMAVGDGANDIPMLNAAGLGVAFHAKPATEVAVEAAGGFAIRQGDLTALLYLQGYRRADFAG